MDFRRLLLSCFAVLSLFMSSCNGFEKIKRSSDVNYKLTMANKYYDKKDYTRARDLYESLLPVMKGTKNFEPMYFRYGMSCFMQKDYYSASYHFRNFMNSFPSSLSEEEAAYYHAYSIYKLSPKITVEQTNTEKAREVLQNFITSYPDSKYKGEIVKCLKEVGYKLEEKSALAAKLYYDISQYKAAAVVYRNLQNDYPFSSRMDEYQLMVVKSNYKYAVASVKDKQEERFVNVLSAYQELVDNYPKSKYIQEAEKYFTLAAEHIKKLKK